MAVKRYKGGWRADWRDERGDRHRRWFKLKGEAQAHEERQHARARSVRAGEAPPPAGDPDVTLAAFVEETFMPRRRAQGIAPGTIESQRSALKEHVLPALGELRVRALHRRVVRDFLLAKLAGTSKRGGPFADGTVRRLAATVSAVLNEARAEGVIADNPTRGLWRELRRGAASRVKGRRVKALMPEQARQLAAAAPGLIPDAWPRLALMMLAGLRPGEALAVTADRLDLAGRRLLVDQQLTQFGGLRPVKDGEGRSVELSRALVEVLRVALERYAAAPREKVVRLDGAPAAAGGGAERGPFVLTPDLPSDPTGKQAQTAYRRTLEAFRRALKAAGLPQHFGLHSLRHTFGSGHVSRGASLAWVRDQMGHSSIALTVDTYGSWIPPEAPGAADALAETLLGAGGHQMDTQAATGGGKDSGERTSPEGRHVLDES